MEDSRFDGESADFLVGMAHQPDRLHLISHTIATLNKLVQPLHSRFFDITRDALSQNDLSGNSPRPQILLLEPLDPQVTEISPEEVPGIRDALNTREPDPDQPLQPSLWTFSTGIRRHTYAIHRNGVIESLLMLDFSATGPIDRALVSTVLGMFLGIENLLLIKDQDPLTGLANRRSFDETITTILDAFPNRARQHRTPGHGAALAIFDIDHFKRVNDLHGHAIGDEVLILFAQMLRCELRHGDKLFRFGGEEFLAILPEVDEKKAKQALERFRASLESYDFPQVGRVTVSIGFVMINRDDFPSELIEKADRALYYAKENGRNQIRSFDKLVGQGKVESIDHATNDIELWG